MTPHRIGLVVPSSNVTVETEVPALLARHTAERFSFHSSRMRMHTVSAEQLRSMNAQRERCIGELADASVDALLYACLVAVMAQGPGEHQRTEDAVTAQLAAAGQRPAVLSSAGALVEALTALGASRIALVTPYLRPLARQVVDYLESEGFEVLDWIALEVDDVAGRSTELSREDRAVTQHALAAVAPIDSDRTGRQIGSLSRCGWFLGKICRRPRLH